MNSGLPWSKQRHGLSDLEWAKKRLFRKSWITPEGCQEWLGSQRSNGYGQIKWNGTMITVHRLSAHIFLGVDLGSDVHVRHSCDNRICFEPSHLLIGTHQDNMDDMNRRNRRAQGLKGMHSTEAGLTRAIIKDFREAGAYISKNHGGPNSQGRPDLEGCYKGIHFLLEVKLPTNKKGATENQKRHIHEARKAGSVAHVVRSKRAAKNVLILIDRMVANGSTD